MPDAGEAGKFRSLPRQTNPSQESPAAIRAGFAVQVLAGTGAQLRLVVILWNMLTIPQPTVPIPTLCRSTYQRKSGKRGNSARAPLSTLLKPVRHRADLSRNASSFINAARDLQLAPSGSPRSSKYSLVTLNTRGASRRSPIRFGTAISPLRVSDRFQTKSTLTLANESAATIHSTR